MIVHYPNEFNPIGVAQLTPGDYTTEMSSNSLDCHFGLVLSVERTSDYNCKITTLQASKTSAGPPASFLLIFVPEAMGMK